MSKADGGVPPLSNDFWDRDLWHRVLLRLYAFTPEYYGSSGPPLDPGIYVALELWYEVRKKGKRGTRVIAVRYYPPVPDSPFAWAHVERGIIDLGKGMSAALASLFGLPSLPLYADFLT